MIGFTSGDLKIFDIRDQKSKMDLVVPKNKTSVSCIAFSNLGKYMAAAWEDNTSTRLYSLHKSCQHVDMIENQQSEGQQKGVRSLAFDEFGNFLAVGTDSGVNLFYYRQPGHPMGYIKTTNPVQLVRFANTLSREIIFRTTDGSVQKAIHS